MLSRFVRIQLVIFTIASIVGVLVMVFAYMQVPTLLGVGKITVKLELPSSGGLYRFSNVTYRGVQVGKVTEMDVSREPGDRDADPRHVAQDPRRSGGRDTQCLRDRRAVRRTAAAQRLASISAGRLGDRHGRHARSRNRSAPCSSRPTP